MATPHNAAEKGQIAQTVLLPGDPLRARHVAENFLEDTVEFNTVRNMLGYTGTWKGKKVSVMGTGMGCPSIGIYSYELIHFYGVTNLIRIGSCGAIREVLQLGDIIMAQGACTDGNYGSQYELPGTYSAIADYGLLSTAKRIADERGYRNCVGNILSSDIFYDPKSGGADGQPWAYWESRWKAMRSTAMRQRPGRREGAGHLHRV